MTDDETHVTEIRDGCKLADLPMPRAAKWALAEIERLTTENAKLRLGISRGSNEPNYT